MIGKIKCIQGGHELTNMFLRKLFNNNSGLSITENLDNTISKETFLKSTAKIAVNA